MGTAIIQPWNSEDYHLNCHGSTRYPKRKTKVVSAVFVHIGFLRQMLPNLAFLFCKARFTCQVPVDFGPDIPDNKCGHPHLNFTVGVIRSFWRLNPWGVQEKISIALRLIANTCTLPSLSQKEHLTSIYHNNLQVNMESLRCFSRWLLNRNIQNVYISQLLPSESAVW